MKIRRREDLSRAERRSAGKKTFCWDGRRKGARGGWITTEVEENNLEQAGKSRNLATVEAKKGRSIKGDNKGRDRGLSLAMLGDDNEGSAGKATADTKMAKYQRRLRQQSLSESQNETKEMTGNEGKHGRNEPSPGGEKRRSARD